MESKPKRVMLNLDPAMAAEVSNLAAAEGMKPSEMYRVLIREALEARADTFYSPMVASATGTAAAWVAAEVRDSVEAEADRIIAELTRMFDDSQVSIPLASGSSRRAPRGGDR